MHCVGDRDLADFSSKMVFVFLHTATACRRYGTGSLVAARCGSSRFQNGSGGGKDVRRVAVGDFFFGFQPVLDVATAELRSVESQRFATDERQLSPNNHSLHCSDH